MSKADEQAFPALKRNVAPNVFETLSEGGLTKREYFAATALQGLLSGDLSAVITKQDIAKAAIIFADTLLEELGKPK